MEPTLARLMEPVMVEAPSKRKGKAAMAAEEGEPEVAASWDED